MKLKFLLIIVLYVSFSCSEKEEKILPQKRTVTESVYTSVIVQPDSIYNVYASVSGLLDENLVEEGAIVFKNQSLMQVINSAPKLNTENAKFALDLAKENYNGKAAVLDAIKDEISAAVLTSKNDSINFYRQKNLWDQNIGSKVEYDTKRLIYKLSQNNLKLLKNRYTRTENELKTALKQASNNYQTSIITTKDFTVKSAINGKVYALYKEPGEIVNTIQPLASIGSATYFILELLVDEVDIVKISEGQKVLITLDAYNSEVFTGKVSKIYPQKDERNQTFTLEAVFDNPPKKLYPGLSGEANIIIAKKDDVLTIPKSYLVDDNKVNTDDGLLEVKIGVQNMEFVEILSVITENTYIYKPIE